MPITTELTLYRFDELDERAKEKARSWWREGMDSLDCGFDTAVEDFCEIAERIGVSLTTRPVKLFGGKTRQKPNVWYSISYSPGDGACFEGSYAYRKGALRDLVEYAPQDVELHRIARSLQAVQARHFYGLTAKMTQSGRYCHEHSMDIDVESGRHSGGCVSQAAAEVVGEAMRDLAIWLKRLLYSELEYHSSDESIDESIIINEYTFRDDGRREDA